ncbi:MAG: hypothetical protein HGJ94_00550 [Desulfosarcina sp.]|nr:hypothetical protein [Desulfosarcina sp.]MBC2742822.1 hypothetical protein [Desulfosarcina sp.]MBC2765732.1 hypothetical protein [Desulfosarcina sp.]
MMSRLGKRWVAAGVIWGVVLAMTGWNIYLISGIQYRRQELAAIRMDQRYLKTNAAGIGQMLAQKSRLTHRVKSFGLGFLVVENDLKRLSWDYGLSQMRVGVEAKNDLQNTRPVPVNVFTKGPVPAMVKWLTAVEEAHPYLQIERMDISYDDRNRMGQLQATFTYRYSLSELERTG